MRNFKKKRRPGNRAMRKSEAARVDEAKVTVCIPCLIWSEMGRMPFEHVATCSDYNHVKSGNIRISHAHGYAGCLWHHRGRIEVDGWTHARMREYFGPSLAEGSRTFHETFGSDDYLIARQTALLTGEAA